MAKKIIKLLLVLFGLALVIVVLITVPTVIKPQPQQLTPSEKLEVERLFNKNFFSLTNLVPYHVSKDETETFIRAYQLYKGVISNEELILIFDSNSGLFESISGHPVPNIPISTNEVVSNADLVSKTMKIIDEDNSYYLSIARPININEHPLYPAIIAAFKARLNPIFWAYPLPLTASLNYYNKSSGSNSPQNWTVAWTVRPKGEDYPVFIMDGNTGQTLYSFDGLIF